MSHYRPEQFNSDIFIDGTSGLCHLDFQWTVR